MQIFKLYNEQTEAVVQRCFVKKKEKGPKNFVKTTGKHSRQSLPATMSQA